MTVIASTINLRKFSPEVSDQGYQNSCVADTLTAAIRLQGSEYREDIGRLAREQIWYDSRIFDGMAPESNRGTSFGTMLPLAMTSGISSQDVALPYNSRYSVPGELREVQSMSVD